MTWSADFAQALDKSKSRLVATEGKQCQANLWLDNKKPLHSDFPWGSQTHKQTVNILKKALNKGLHDISVHIKHKFCLFKDFFFIYNRPDLWYIS